jgi:glycosyltransferase involved in cell wall biosynthesis
MRLGFDGKRAAHNLRGLGNYSRGIIEGLLEYSHEEIFLYFSESKNPRILEWLEKNHSKRLHLRNPSTKIGKMLPSLWRTYFIPQDLNKDQLDIFHGLSHEIPFNLQSTKYKKVVTIHDLIFKRFPHYFPAIDRMTYEKKFQYAVKNSDLVLAICEQTKLDIIKYLHVPETKIKVHYQSCDPLFYTILAADEKENIRKRYKLESEYILNVGAFEERKNQINLIKAFASLLDKIPHDLVLIGNGESYKNECVNLIKKLNLEGRVKILSTVPFTDLPGIYQASSLFCFPSHFEGFGLPIVEALFSKVPVITSKGSCFPESAGPSSCFVDSNSVDELTQEIEKILSNPLKQNEMIKNGFEFVQKFHRKNVNQLLLDHYSQLFN